MAFTLHLTYRPMIFRLLLKHILCMSAFIACAQTESTPSLAIQNASTAEKSGTPAALKASTSEVPLPDLKQLNLPPVDVPERTKQTLDHLDLAARHYRAIAAPLQTVGGIASSLCEIDRNCRSSSPSDDAIFRTGASESQHSPD